MCRTGWAAPPSIRAAGGQIGPVGWPAMPVARSPHRAATDAHNTRPSSLRPAATSRPRPDSDIPISATQASLGRDTMEDIVIVAAARTAVGKFGGSLAKIAAPELGAAVLKELLVRAKLSPEQINEVILGQVLAAGSGQNPARQAVIKGGLAQATPG